jgi:[protein-PII] uridylyltransferase
MIEPVIDDYLGRFEDNDVASSGSEVSEAVKVYIAACQNYLREIHESGGSGREVNEAHSDLIDRLIRRLFQLSEQIYFRDGGEAPNELCILAVGGYARREMSIHSDVDMLFLYADMLTPYVNAMTKRMQLWLWDANLARGAATRTISETLSLAKSDETVCTALVAPRYLAGSGVLYHRFGRTVDKALFSKPDRFISQQIVAFESRHSEFGDSLYLLQPNLKEGAGGLRDYHASRWVMHATQGSARGKDDYLFSGLLTEEESSDFFQGLDFLWRVRNELHLMGGRKNDQMSFEHQERIAEAFGYGSASDDQTELPVERFMRDYYIHARNILNDSSLVMEQCLTRVRPPPKRRRIEYVERGLRVVNGQLEIPHARQLKDDPVLLLDVFSVAQAYDVPLTRKARRLVHEHLDLIDEDFQRSPEARDAFLRILRSPHRVARSLLAMNEAGVLASYLPEWDHIVCRWQHVIYHTYTVDVHSIFLVEELRRLRKGDYQLELPDLTDLMRSVHDPVVLYLSCLFHDVGKGLGGNHSIKGVDISRTCMERIGLDDEIIERVTFLVETHLIMSHLAQRRDLSDPKLILEFARTVKDRRNLRNLFLLTVADMRASSKKAWTDWKGRLLRDLFEKTAELLEIGADDANQAIDLIERRVETRIQSATAQLERDSVPPEEVARYFEMMPRRYFTAHTPKQIARHARVVFDLAPAQVLSFAAKELRGGFSELILCTPDRPELFADVAGTLTAHNINILGAHVYTSRSGLALEVYRVTTPPGDAVAHELVWRDFERSLRRVLAGETDVAELLKSRGRPIGAERPNLARRPHSVTVDSEESDFYTIVDIAADDRLGLLHDLTREIAKQGYEVYISKAALVLDQVTDTFYIKDREGKKVLDPELLSRLEQGLRDALQAGEGGG